MNRAVPVVKASHLVYDAISHQAKVKSLYKRVMHNIKAWTLPDICEYRYQAVKMRQRFEDNRNIKDFRVVKKLMEDAEEELFHNLHPYPLYYPYSPGGVCYDREFIHPDWVLDYWHPLEKARYPHYFARREQRKLEYIRLYEQEYGDSLKNLHMPPPQDYTKSS